MHTRYAWDFENPGNCWNAKYARSSKEGDARNEVRQLYNKDACPSPTEPGHAADEPCAGVMRKGTGQLSKHAPCARRSWPCSRRTMCWSHEKGHRTALQTRALCSQILVMQQMNHVLAQKALDGFFVAACDCGVNHRDVEDGGMHHNLFYHILLKRVMPVAPSLHPPEVHMQQAALQSVLKGGSSHSGLAYLAPRQSAQNKAGSAGPVRVVRPAQHSFNWACKLRGMNIMQAVKLQASLAMPTHCYQH
eukprot:scaffold94395_cov17-Tisochrysis_lutea.AAC.1